MKAGYPVLLLMFFAGTMVASSAYADSCPYCGQQYGDAAPGDEARVYSLRQDHEATCSARQSGSIYGSGGMGYDTGGAGYDAAAAARQAEAERLRQEEEQLLVDKELARRKGTAQMKSDVADALRQQEEFLAGKEDVLSKLKGGTATPTLKGGDKMPVVQPLALKGQEKEKGVHFKEPPVPGTRPQDIKEPPTPEWVKRPQWIPAFARDRTALVLDALRAGGKEGEKGDWNKTMKFLEDELAKGKGTEQPNIQEAISYLEGIRDAEASAEPKKTPEPAKPPRSADPASSVIADQILLEMAARRNGQNVVWPGQKNPNPNTSIPNPLTWKEERLAIAADGFIHGGYNLDKSIQYLNEKAARLTAAGESDLRTLQAAQYLEGVRAYADYRESLGEQKK